MSPHLDQREREELCALFLEVGPDAPTLDEGWTTADLAAHLVVRERDPRSGPGIVRPDGRFGAYTAKLIERRKAKGFENNVARVRKGAPLIPWRLPKLRTLLNLNEYFVHHEDVRRANGQTRRTDRPDLDDVLWDMLRRGAKLTTRSLKDGGLVLVRGNGDQIVVHQGDNPATIVGEPSEIALYLTGRRSAAVVDIRGEPDAVDRVVNAKLGI